MTWNGPLSLPLSLETARSVVSIYSKFPSGPAPRVIMKVNKREAQACRWYAGKGEHENMAGNLLPGRQKRRQVLTSWLVELQGDVSIKSEAEVIIEDIQRKLKK